MTDKYSSDLHEQGIPSEHEHEGLSEHESQAWQHEPPVDDFADSEDHHSHADALTEETATVSEEAESLESDEEAPAEIAPRKSFALLPVVAGIGGVLLLGGVLYWQFGGTSQNEAALPLGMAKIIAAQPQEPPAAAPPAASVAPAAETAPKTALDLADLSSAPAPAASSGLAIPTPNVPSSPVALMAPPIPPAPVPVPLAPIPASSAPVVAAVEPVSPIASSMPSPAAPSAPVPVLPPHGTNGGAVDQRLNALSSRVEDLQKSLDQATTQVSQVSNMMAMKQPPVSGEANPELQDRLNRLEQKLAQMERTSPVAVNQSVPTVTKHKTTHIKSVVSSKTKKKTHPVSHKQAKTTAHWVLRAATPTEAWVSQSVSSPELRHVQVGETLAGIGRVRAIRSVGDGWVVEGTKGSVR